MYQVRSTQNLKRGSLAIKAALIVCLLVLSLPAVAHADDPWPSLACNESELGAQQILICTPPPAQWNGQLVVYAHGYVEPQMPLALPAEELGRLTLPGGTTVVDFLLSQGYAFATSSYSKNGYAVWQAGKDLNALVRHFKTKVLPNAGMLKKVLIVGGSEGALIATMLVEKHPGIYDGGLAMCGPTGGMPAQLQYLGHFRVVFDAFFPQVFRNPPPNTGLPAFGMTDVPEDAWLYWDVYEQVAVPLAMQGDILAVQQLFAVTGAAFDPLDLTSYGVTALQVLRYSVWGTPDMIATAGGMPYDNQDTVYVGSLDDPALNAVVERVDADGQARAYARRAYQPTGKLKRPLVTLHNEDDPAVPYWHEEIYAALAAPSGQFFPYPYPLASDYGHCEFTPDEVLGAFGMLTGLVGE
jgi:pimeloyl-ACP methyl ester carboxylesterase